MSDTAMDEPATDDETDSQGDAAASDESTEHLGATDRDSRERIVTALQYGALAVLLLLALVSLFRFYFAASNAISIWISNDFVPIFQAVFNLVVLVLAVLGLSVLVRRIT
jgi:hypothetical protein